MQYIKGCSVQWFVGCGWCLHAAISINGAYGTVSSRFKLGYCQFIQSKAKRGAKVIFGSAIEVGVLKIMWSWESDQVRFFSSLCHSKVIYTRQMQYSKMNSVYDWTVQQSYWELNIYFIISWLCCFIIGRIMDSSLQWRSLQCQS